MSRYYTNYTQYLGSQRCCDLRGQGPKGDTGPTGASAIGQKGPKGDTGYTGPTGRSCKGDTGPRGPPGTTLQILDTSPPLIPTTGSIYLNTTNNTLNIYNNNNWYSINLNL